MITYKQRPAVLKIIEFSHRHRWSKYLCVGAVSAIYAYDCVNEFIFLSGEKFKDTARESSSSVPGRIISGVTAAAFAVMSVPFAAAAEGMEVFAENVREAAQSGDTVEDTGLPLPNLTPEEYIAGTVSDSIVTEETVALPSVNSAVSLISVPDTDNGSANENDENDVNNEEIVSDGVAAESESSEEPSAEPPAENADGVPVEEENAASDEIPAENEPTEDITPKESALSGETVSYSDHSSERIYIYSEPSLERGESTINSLHDTAPAQTAESEAAVTAAQEENSAAAEDQEAANENSAESTDGTDNTGGTENADTVNNNTDNNSGSVSGQAAKTDEDAAVQENTETDGDKTENSEPVSEKKNEDKLNVTVAGIPEKDSRYAVVFNCEEDTRTGSITIELKKGTKQNHRDICAAFDGYSVNTDMLNIIPFRMEMYDDNGEHIELNSSESVELIMPIPKSMKMHRSDLRIIHLEGSYIGILDSEYIENEDSSLSVRFTANNSSVYAFVAYAGNIEDIQSAAGGFSDADMSVSVSGLNIPDIFPERRRNKFTQKKRYRVVRKMRKKDLIF